MTFIRSLLFYGLFYTGTLVLAILSLPFLILPQKAAFIPPRVWIWYIMFLLKYVCGLRYKITGQEYITQAQQQNGALLIASQHQSAWETFIMYSLFPKPLYVLKKSLLNIPLIGYYISKVGCIAIDRKGKSRVINQLVEQAVRAKETGRQIVIFPEGTRNSKAKKIPLKSGIDAIAKATQLPVLPVTLNAGAFWGRNSFLKHSGEIELRFHPPLQAADEIRPQLSSLFFK